jgi:1,4-dihydroxy-2-naphthoyl-CoA hydrolase
MSSIWFKEFTLAQVSDIARNTMVSHVGIEVTEIGDDYLRGRMPVDQRTRQPFGILHGGASVVLAETLASIGCQFTVDWAKFRAVGLEINANHIRAVSEGFVTGIARPLHLGRRTQVWEIRITDERDKLSCISRITMAIIDRKGDE